MENFRSGSDGERSDTLPSGFMRLEHTLADLPLMLYAGVGYTERFPDYWELFSPKFGPNGSKDPFSSVKSENHAARHRRAVQRQTLQRLGLRLRGPRR